MDHTKLVDASPWHPITDQLDLKYLGKLGEEATEMSTAIFRCIIQGLDEAEPVTGKINRAWLQDEVADVYAGLALTVKHFQLDEEAIRARKKRKMDHLSQWHSYAEAPPVAWEYEQATRVVAPPRPEGGDAEGHYSGWVRRLSHVEPDRGASDIRNVRALR
jgi:hypothetical protein